MRLFLYLLVLSVGLVNCHWTFPWTRDLTMDPDSVINDVNQFLNKVSRIVSIRSLCHLFSPLRILDLCLKSSSSSMAKHTKMI